MGNTGGLVTRLQVMLDYLSNYYSDLPHVHVDGAFGSATRNAVVAFQHRFGLSEDGRVGPATWDKLYEVYLANNGNGQGPSIPNPGDPVVRQIQTTLNLRYDAGLAVDGIFGPATKAALIRGLQSELNTQFGRNLALTGTFDAATRAATVNVRPGASGNITYLLQAALFANGHANVVPDGIFGPRTEAAVRQFQRDQGLSADGVIGPLTQERLFR
jgi:peptidoglycan hydrolase-like protein with peptidoglycan-binding domain